MSDPERLLDQKERALQTTLLRAALDESPPSGLTRRTLIALGVVAAAASTGGAAVGVGGVVAGAGRRSYTSRFLRSAGRWKLRIEYGMTRNLTHRIFLRGLVAPATGSAPQPPVEQAGFRVKPRTGTA